MTESGAKNALAKKKDAVRVPMAPNIDRQFSRHNISFFRGALKTSEDDTGSLVSEVAMLSRKDSGINNTNAFSTSFHENKLGLGLSPLPSMDTFRLGRKSTMNLETVGSEYNLDEEKAVPAGLIDYCVILGKLYAAESLSRRHFFISLSVPVWFDVFRPKESILAGRLAHVDW